MGNDTLSWDDHVKILGTKALKSINLLRRLAWFLPRKALCIYYNAYMLPHLTYTDAVWNTCTVAQASTLERLQNYVARVILGRRRNVSTTAMRHELGWPTLASRRKLSKVTAVFTAFQGTAPQYLSALFKPSSQVHQHETRSSTNKGLLIPHSCTNHGKISLAFFVGQRAGMFCH